MGNSLLYRGLCAGLALTFLVPPNVLFAQDVKPGKRPAAPRKAAEPATLDLTGLDAIDVQPHSGGLLYGRVDLVVGEGSQAFPIRRTYRPGAGDLFNMGLAWTTVLDHHLDVDPSGERASFVGEDGQRVFFERKGKRFVALTGPRAVVERKRDGFVLTGLGDERTYRFDAKGWLLSRTGPNLTVTYAYDARDRLVKVVGPWGALRVERDALGVLRTLRAPDGRTVRYQRDRSGNLVKVTRRALYETYSYDPAGRLSALQGGKATVAYDVLGRVIRISGTALRERTVRYLGSDGEWAHQTIITQGDRATAVAVSANGRVIRRTDADGLSSTTHLDDRDRPIKIVTADGSEYRRSFDAKGRLRESTGPRGLTRYEYDSKITDRPTRVTLPDGRWLASTYDLTGKLISVSSSTGARTTWTYDGRGLLVKKVDPRGAVTRYFREQGRLVRVEEDGKGVTRFLRDEQGRLSRIQQPDGRLIRVERTADGRTTRIADGRGPTSEKTVDARGRLVRYSDAFGRTYDYTWSDEGELLKVRDAMGALISFDYDASGRLTGLEDGAGNHTTIRREGRTLTVTDPTQGERVLKRDAKGRLVEEIRGGVRTAYAYDAVGQLIERKSPSGTETFEYDAFGRLTGMKGPDGALSMAFDEDGRLAKIENPAIGKTVEYSYSKTGDRSSLRLPWGRVNYRYDVQGRVKSIELPEGGSIEFEHTADGRRKEIRYPNGVVTTFSYKRTRLHQVLTKREGQVIERRRYGYGSDGRVAWTEGRSGDRTTYTHDARGRLTEVKSKTETISYRYDASGNRVEELRGDRTIKTEIGPGNRVVSRTEAGSTETFTYGASGSLDGTKTKSGVTRFVYDNDDQLVRAERPGGEVVRYGYAPNGTRLWREDESGRTYFLNDLSDVVGEFSAAGALKTSFVHGPGNDDVLSATKDGEQFFYHYDLVRSVTAITGREGRVAARYDYDAFGAQKGVEGDAAAWNPFRYTSRAFDAGTGLYDYRSRTYDPAQGRFTSADPAGIRGGLNLYAYAANDPVLFNDPFGFWPDWFDSAASWVGDQVDAVGGAIDTGVTAAGTAINSGVTAAGGWVADNLIPEAIRDEVSYLGRQSWAFTRGFGKGIYGASKGVVTMVRHPVDTYSGIKHAVENWDETKEAMVQLWEKYKDAAVNDPEMFAEMTGVLAAEIVFSVAGTKGLDKLAKAAKVGTVGRLAGATSRVSRVTSPIVNATTRAGSSLARRFPRVVRTLRRGRVLSRARRLELARRAANPGRWVTRFPRRVATFGRDVWSGARMAAREPGAFVVYTGTRLGATFGGLVSSTGRGLWTASKWGGIPVVIAFEDEITDAIKRSKTREDAMGEVTRKGQALLRDAEGLSPEELAVRVREAGEAYVNFRNRLLGPINDEDKRLEAALEELNTKVANGEVPAEAIDARVLAMFKEFGRRRQNLMTDLYDRNRDADHDMLHPSMNRTISFQDEVDLLEAAKAKVTSPESKALLDARIADVKATMEYEYNLYRSGDHDALIAGIAGPPRPAGEASVNDDTYGLEGLNFDDLDTTPGEGATPVEIYEDY